MNLERPRFEAREPLLATPPDLAHLEPFDLGAVQVAPAMRRLERPAGPSIIVEPLVMQVLVSLARARGGTLSRDDLVTECWGRRFVGDDAVNRVISRLRRSLAQVAGDQVGIETIAKVGYRLSIAPTDQAGAAIVVDAADAVPARNRPVVSRVLTLGLLLTFAIVGIMIFAQRPAPVMTIAIEPITGLGNDVASAQLAAELTGDVARLTGSMTQLTLLEPHTATDADMKLEVAHRGPASDGNARVRLVDSKSGAVLWSRAVEATDVPSSLIRERAAYAIAGVIRCGLHRSTGNLGDPVSKRLYFAACDAVEARDWPRARSFAQQITNLRPDSAASWACLALTTAHGIQQDPGSLANDAPKVIAYARRALALDPRSGLAHQAYAMALDLQGHSGFEMLEKGVKLDPEHGGLLASYGQSLFALGYLRASIAPATRAMALEPNDFGLTQVAIFNLMGAGRIQEAEELQSRADRLWPDRRDLLLRSGNELLFYAHDPSAALQSLAQNETSGARSALWPLELQWRVAPTRFDWTAFDRAAEQLFSSAPRAAWAIAFSATRMNDTQRALAWLGKSPAKIEGRPWRSLFWPDAAKLRRDPRFFAKMAEVGLVADWRKRDRWPDFCSDPGLRYDCRQEARRLADMGRI